MVIITRKTHKNLGLPEIQLESSPVKKKKKNTAKQTEIETYFSPVVKIRDPVPELPSEIGLDWTLDHRNILFNPYETNEINGICLAEEFIFPEKTQNNSSRREDSCFSLDPPANESNSAHRAEANSAFRTCGATNSAKDLTPLEHLITYATDMRKDIQAVKTFLSECHGLLTTLTESLIKTESLSQITPKTMRTDITNQSQQQQQGPQQEKQHSEEKKTKTKTKKSNDPKDPTKKHSGTKKSKNLKNTKKIRKTGPVHNREKKQVKMNFQKLFNLLDKKQDEVRTPALATIKDTPELICNPPTGLELIKQKTACDLVHTSSAHNTLHQVRERTPEPQDPWEKVLSKDPISKKKPLAKGGDQHLPATHGTQRNPNWRLTLEKNKLVINGYPKPWGRMEQSVRKDHLMKLVGIAAKGLLSPYEILQVEYLHYNYYCARAVITFINELSAKKMLSLRSQFIRKGMIISRLFRNNIPPISLLMNTSSCSFTPVEVSSCRVADLIDLTEHSPGLKHHQEEEHTLQGPCKRLLSNTTPSTETKAPFLDEEVQLLKTFQQLPSPTQIDIMDR